MARIRLQPMSIDDSIIHLSNFDFFLKGREVFFRDDTRGKLLKTGHETFGKTDFTSMHFMHALGVSFVVC